MALHDPLVKPYHSAIIFCAIVYACKKKPAILAVKPLLIVLLAPTNDIFTAASPARFFPHFGFYAISPTILTIISKIKIL
jgi:hypothetical protein